MRSRRTVAAVAAVLTLAGCSDPTGTSSGPGHNEADVDFAGDMIQHHAQALEMVDLTMGRDLDPEVEQLTEQIRDAQAPEIERMADWLEEWDEPVPATSRDHASEHGSGHGALAEDMPGMMSAEAMQRLEDATGDEFQDLWLEMMIEHHEGAVEMAETQVEEGRNRRAIALAKEIIGAQEREIATMQDLLAG